jgi:hypothetical protein
MKTFTLRMNSVASVLRRLLGGAFCAQTWSVVALAGVYKITKASCHRRPRLPAAGWPHVCQK